MYTCGIAWVTDGIKTVYVRWSLLFTQARTFTWICRSTRSYTANGILIKQKVKATSEKCVGYSQQGNHGIAIKIACINSLTALVTVFHMVMRDDHLVNKTLRTFRSWLLPYQTAELAVYDLVEQ